MNSQTSLVARKYRLQKWAGMVRECNSRPAGMTVNDWCDQHSITKADYYYRMKAVRKACLDTIPSKAVENAIVPVPMELMITETPEPQEVQTEASPNDSSIELYAHGITLRVTDQTSSDLLAKVLGVIVHVE